MADQTVYMDVPRVRKFGQDFVNFGQVLKQVANTIEALMTVLKFTAFVGMVGGVAVERYLAQLKPGILKLAAKMEEIGGDLEASATAYQNGDLAGSTRFY